MGLLLFLPFVTGNGRTSRWHALGSASVLSQDRHIPMVLGKSHSGHRGHRAALGATKAVPKPHAGVEMESEIIN